MRHNTQEHLPNWLKTEEQKRQEAQRRQQEQAAKKMVDDCTRLYGQAGSIFKEGLERGTAHPQGLGNVDGGAVAVLFFFLWLFSQFM